MKYLLLTIGLIVSLSFFATAAQAARPCKVIAEACFAAGIIHRGESRDVILAKCVKPVISGRGVAGVNVDSSVISACRAKVASR